MRPSVMQEVRWLNATNTNECKLFQYLSLYPGLICECRKLCDYGVTLTVLETCFNYQMELEITNTKNMTLTLQYFETIITNQTCPQITDIEKQRNETFELFCKIAKLKQSQKLILKPKTKTSGYNMVLLCKQLQNQC